MYASLALLLLSAAGEPDASIGLAPPTAVGDGKLHVYVLAFSQSEVALAVSPVGNLWAIGRLVPLEEPLFQRKLRQLTSSPLRGWVRLGTPGGTPDTFRQDAAAARLGGGAALQVDGRGNLRLVHGRTRVVWWRNQPEPDPEPAVYLVPDARLSTVGGWTLPFKALTAGAVVLPFPRVLALEAGQHSLAALRALQIPAFRTDLDGDIHLVSDGHRMDAYVSRSPAGGTPGAAVQVLP